jgi:hypothetical protein
VLSRRGFALSAALGALLSPFQALAQSIAEGVESADSGWFDPPPGGAGVADPSYPAPEAEPAPAPEPADVPDTDPSALTTFKPTLDPYGRWESDPNYGTVWVPHAEAVGPGFAPYVSRGNWALTADDDWIWVSDYPFGWAVFHYGRWVWISNWGWSWVPGRTYANAWVVWRVPSAGYAYVGWAPMPPSWVWVDGYAVSLYYAPPLPFVFCHSSYVFHRHVHSYIVHDRAHVHRIAAHTHIYPTPYHAPARPQAHAAAAPSRAPAAPGRRAAPPPRSGVPRGPGTAAARVPPSSIPAVRTGPPPSAQRLSGFKRTASPSNFSAQRSEPELRSRSSAAERLPAEARRPVTSEVVRRSTPSASGGRSNAPVRAPSSNAPVRAPSSNAPSRAVSPSRVKVEPRSAAPARVRALPSSGGGRSLSPATSRIRRLPRP